MYHEHRDGAERRRLKALERFAIMDTPPDDQFDEITRLAAAAFNVAHCAISLIDDRRQWFKSRVNITICETPREDAFCAYAVEARAFLEVSDALLDARFINNPLVTGEPHIRFYAGAPLMVEGYCLGTLCIFDPAPRSALDARERQILTDLCKLASDIVQTRTARRMGEVTSRVVEATSDAILCVDLKGIITFWNMAAERIFGHSIDAAIGQSLDLILPKSHAVAHHNGFARAAAGGETTLVGKTVELCARRRDGSEFPVELSLARWGAGSDGGFAAIMRDISNRKQMERERRHAEQFLNTIITHLPAMLFVKEADSRQYLMVNRAGERLIGRPAEDIVGKTDRDLFPAFGASYEERDTHALTSNAVESYESVFERDDGSSVSLRTKRIVIDGPDAPRQYILGLSEDLTDVRNSEARVLHLAHYDALTGLRNRASVNATLDDLVASGTTMAILSIDLDRFKAVNDQYGHLTGDDVLATVGLRLKSLVRPSDLVARIGGDEFIIITIDKEPIANAQRIGRSVVRALGEPFTTDRAKVQIGASVGVVIAPDDGSTAYELRQAADLALYRAKREGRGSICFFSREMDAEAQHRRTLERDLGTAIDAGEIAIAFQPVICARTGRITSAEALARWTHCKFGAIGPDVFVGLAEECGLIETLGRQVLRQACAAAAHWPAHIKVAVNLSPKQFESGNLVQTIIEELAISGLAPARLQLEVTEGLLIRDVDRTFDILTRLRALGIQILMDDFGIGYSSLSYFERFPFDKVKVDRSFIEKVGHSKASRAIIQAVVGLGSKLDMGIVAEGVETEAQRRELVAAGCTHLQGFFFSRPVAADILLKLIEANANIPYLGSDYDAHAGHRLRSLS